MGSEHPDTYKVYSYITVYSSLQSQLVYTQQTLCNFRLGTSNEKS